MNYKLILLKILIFYLSANKLFAQFETTFDQTPVKILYMQKSLKHTCSALYEGISPREVSSSAVRISLPIANSYPKTSFIKNRDSGCYINGNYFACQNSYNNPVRTLYVGTSSYGTKYSMTSFENSHGNVLNLNIPNSERAAGYDIDSIYSCGYSFNGVSNEAVLVINENESFNNQWDATTLLFDFSQFEDDEAYSISVKSNYVLMAGKSGNSIFVSKHNLDGSLDISFGINGVIYINENLLNKKSVCLNTYGNNFYITYVSNNALKVRKYNSLNSSLVNSFANSGELTINNLQLNDSINSVKSIVMPNGDIFIAELVLNQSNGKIILSKYNQNGNVVNNFNNGESKVLEGRFCKESLSLLFNPSSMRVWISSSIYEDLRDGFKQISYSLDYSLGDILDTVYQNECKDWSTEPIDLKLDSTNNRVVVLCRTLGSIAPVSQLLGFKTTGEIDRDFGENGRVILSSGGTSAIEKINGGYLLANLGVYKINNDGNIDSMFGVNGYAFPNAFGRRGIHLMDNGDVVTIDNLSNSSSPSIFKIKPIGFLDSTFNFNGILEFDDSFQAKKLTSKDGFIYAAGIKLGSSSNKLTIAKVRASDGFIIYVNHFNINIPNEINTIQNLHSFQILDNNEMMIGFTNYGIGGSSPKIYSMKIDLNGSIIDDYGINGILRHQNFANSSNSNSSSSYDVDFTGKIFYDDINDSILVFIGGVTSIVRMNNDNFILFGVEKKSANNGSEHEKLKLQIYSLNDTSTAPIDTTGNPNNIQYVSSTLDINITPNPTNDFVDIKLNENFKSIIVEQYNYLGQKLNSDSFTNSNDIKFSIKGESGLYILVININNSQKLLFKILKS